MSKYFKYFKYVIEHKKNVFIECWNKKMYVHAFMHDVSKFNPKEFIPYSNWFYGFQGVRQQDCYNQYKDDKNWMSSFGSKHLKCKQEFDVAWQHHKDKNKHHWNYWYERSLEMPRKYIDQMICDWSAMSRKFGDTPQEFYLSNYHKIKFIDDDNSFCSSRHNLELKLGLLEYNEPLCEGNKEFYMSMLQILSDYQKYCLKKRSQ